MENVENVNNLIKLRDAYHLSEIEFAEKLGTTVKVIKAIEQGKIEPDRTLLKLAAIVFDLPEGFFVLNDIGEKIKNIRCGNNLSEFAFAKKLGITSDKVKEIEQGFQFPDKTLLILITTLFELSDDYFGVN